MCVCHWETVLENNDLVFWEIKCEDYDASVLEVVSNWPPLNGL